MKFLGQIAQAFFEKEREEISKICFVFPGRRAALFFQRELGVLLDKPLFSPSLVTINDLFTDLSGLRKIDKLESVYKLYKIYCSISDNPDSFDDFIYWGETLLSDFDDTDKFIANAPRLFANIRDLKELEADYSFLTDRQLIAIQSFWSNFHNGEESKKKTKFTALWSMMLPLYSSLREELESEGVGYEGMIYRKIAEEIQEGKTESIDTFLDRFKKVVFVGFNALNECEKLILNYIRDTGKGDFYWDYYGDMVTDPDNKASYFMKENLIKYPSSINLNYATGTLPQIEVIGVPSVIGQVKIAGEIVSTLPSGLNSTLILPDESLLTSVMRSLDHDKGEINITMGYPLREASVVSLAESLIELQSGPFYFRKVLPILRHSYVRGISGDAAMEIEREIISGNMLYVSQSLFERDQLLKMIFKKVFSEEDSKEKYISKVASYILDILDYIVRNKLINKFEKELVYYFYTLVVRLKDLQIPMSQATFLRLLKQLVNSTSVPFKGEPLAGLQVMGVLESRCLDFDNAIICSMNEGVFPSKNINSSFIPLNLRRGFALPDNEYADAVSAYNFYRTIYRAKRVWLLYDTRSEGLSSGEQSRFIMQLKYHYRVSLKESISAGVVTRKVKEPIIVHKDERVINELNRFRDGSRNFSASSLSTYITCPLKFYFMQIERVKDEEELSESIESRTFGTILHNTMASLYKDSIGKELTSKDLDSKLNNQKLIDNIISDELRKEKGVDEIKGYNYIVCNLIARYVNKILIYDKEMTPFKYIESEKEFISLLKLADGNEIRLRAFVDRLDRVSGKLRIVDYKTGGKPGALKEIEDLFEQNSSKNLSVFFQLYLYALIVSPDVESMLTPYFLRELGIKHQTICTPEDIVIFKALLIDKILEILDPDNPFVQTTDTKSCEYCIFKQICR